MFGYNTQQPLTEGRRIMKLFVWNIYFMTEADQAKTEKKQTIFYPSWFPSVIVKH